MSIKVLQLRSIYDKIVAEGFTMEIYSRIDALLMRQNISRRGLAEKAEIPYSTIASAFSRKSAGLSFETLHKIASALGVSVMDLTGSKDDYWHTPESTFDFWLRSLGYEIGGDSSEGYMWINQIEENKSFEFSLKEFSELQTAVAKFTKYQIYEILKDRRSVDIVKNNLSASQQAPE